jgi:uncharacterized protein involved in response to NO
MYKELGLSSTLLCLLFLLFDPFHLLMLSSVQMLILCSVAVAFLLYGIFLFRTNVQDEREQLHVFVASKLGYLIGAAVLTFAIVAEKLSHHSVSWLIIALAGMVLGKIIGLLYAQYKK